MATATELYVVSGNLAKYAHAKIANHLKRDYERQVGKWQRHFDIMVAAQVEAVKSHLDALKEARDDIERARQFAAGLAMLAFSIVGGPLLNWLGAKIEHHWFPKFAGKLQDRWHWIGKERVYQTEHRHNQMLAQLFGDVTKDAGKGAGALLIEKAFKPAAPNADLANQARTATTVAASANPWEFQNALKHAMSKQVEVTTDQFMGWANQILENRKFGQECLEKLYKKNPGLKDPTARKEVIEDQGMTLIVDEIDEKRDQWARSSDWFYYSNDPPGMTQGEFHYAIEMEIWALWLLNEGLHMERRTSYDMNAVEGGHAASTHEWYPVVGKTFGDSGVPQAVLRRLAEFGILKGRTAEQQRADAKRESEKLKKREAEWRLDVVKGGGSEAKKLKQWAQEDGEEAKSRPLFDVGRAVDVQSEINDLETWAKKHPLSLSGMRLTGRTRLLQSIKDIYR